MISFNLFSLSLLAGALAAFNPGGFVLLPAYLTSLIRSGDVGERKAPAYVRATRFSLGMTVGFIGVFGGFALVVAPIAGSLEKFLPTITIIVGIASRVRRNLRTRITLVHCWTFSCHNCRDQNFRHH